MKKLNIFTPPPKKTHNFVSRLLTAFLCISFSLSLFGCNGSEPTTPVTSSEDPDLRCEEIEDFSNDNKFWDWVYENVPTVTASDISSGSYDDTYVCFDALVIGAVDHEGYIELPTVAQNSSGEDERKLFIIDTDTGGNLKYGEDIFENVERSDKLKFCGKVSNGSFIDSNIIAIQNMGKDTDFDMDAFLEKDMERQKKEAAERESSVADTEKPIETEIPQNEVPSQTDQPSKPVPFSLEYGKLLDANPDGGVDMNTLVIKAKIEPNLTNRMTITQNYQNIIQMLQKDDYTQYDSIQYWAVADMTDGSEGKVISFTVDKSCIEAITNGTIASGDTLEEYLTDLWILPSLQEN